MQVKKYDDICLDMDDAMQELAPTLLLESIVDIFNYMSENPNFVHYDELEQAIYRNIRDQLQQVFNNYKYSQKLINEIRKEEK